MTSTRPAAAGTSRQTCTFEVRRTGGFAGLTTAASIAPDGPRWGEADALLGRIDFATGARTAPQPDRFSYVFVVNGSEVTVAEQDLSDDQRRLAELALGGVQDR